VSVAVYGLGNVLRRDDGFGPSAAARLEASHEFPSGVEVRDLGTPGLDLASHLVGRDAVVFLDTARGDGPPGTIHVYGRDEILSAPQHDARVTGHELDVRAALILADLVGGGPRVVRFVGVVPEDLGDGIGLSGAVLAALDPATDLALSELARLGVVPRARSEPLAMDAWWERCSGGATERR
jgi:hydrogenase maturation protease